MSRIVSINSFRKGTGKSHTAANVAVLLAAQGLRVALLDADTQVPSLYPMFGLKQSQITHSLVEHLEGKCTLEDAAIDVTSHLENNESILGQIYLITCTVNGHQSLSTVLPKDVFAFGLRDALTDLVAMLELDIIIVDTAAGLGPDELLFMALSQSWVIVMNLDQQDYQGTGVTVEVARKLDVPRVAMLINNVAPGFNSEDVKHEVEEVYGNPVVAVLPYTDELMTLGGMGIFVIRYPNHPLTAQLRKAANRLLVYAVSRPEI